MNGLIPPPSLLRASEKLQSVRCVCPVGHSLCAITIEGERIMSSEELQQRMRDSIDDGRFGTECMRCGAPRSEWRIEAEWR